MALGFPYYYSEYQALNKMSKLHYIFIAIETVKKLSWKTVEISENEIIAKSQNTTKTWNEFISIDLKNDAIFIKSWSEGNQIYDRNRNQKNVDSFLDLFYVVKSEKDITDDNEIFFHEYLKNEINTVTYV